MRTQSGTESNVQIATEIGTESAAPRSRRGRRYVTVASSLACLSALGLSIAAGAHAATPAGRVVGAAGQASIASISPSIQAGEASQEVDILGSGFTGATQVSFGGVADHQMVVVSDGEIYAVAPAHANGTVDVVVSTPNGAITLPGSYTYTDPTSQNIFETVSVAGWSGQIAAFNCPAATPYLRRFDGDTVTGYEPDDEFNGLIANHNPQYYTNAQGQALGVTVSYTNLDVTTHTIHPTLHCTNNAFDGFTTGLTPNQPIQGPYAPSPTSSSDPMDQTLPVMINDSNSWLKITDVWATNPNGENFIDSAMPQVGQVIAPNQQVAVNVHFFADGPTLHLRFTDDHGDVLETSVSGSSFMSGFQRSWSCSDTAGANLQCHPTTAHMQDSTIVQIQNAG
jgi:hypothetical protein